MPELPNGRDRRASRLLVALAPEHLSVSRPIFEIADLPQGTGLCESGDPIRDAYCPRDCLVSLAAVLKDGDPVLDGEPGDAHPSGRGPHPEEPRRLTVTDRAGLKDISGECYGVIRRAFERLLPDTYARR